MNFTKNKAIKKVAKRQTTELINYLEDGPQIDFFKALKNHIGKEIIECPIDNITSDDCSKWSELLVLIVWEKTRQELAYDPTMGDKSDFWVLNNTVLEELRKWEKVIKVRAGKSM
jgi:hypothetical protein